MSFWDAWFGTLTEKKREQYRALYQELNTCLTDFHSKLKKLEGKVEGYSASRPRMSESFIPEDVFSVSESSVKGKVEMVTGHQSSDVGKLSQAVDTAYQRYRHYAHLAEQERLEREAEQRRQAERRRREAKKRYSRR